MQKIIIRKRFNLISLLAGGMILLFASNQAFAERCRDADGDGFGWNGTESCGVCLDRGFEGGMGWNKFTQSKCSLADNCVDDKNGDEWGYDEANRRSCRLPSNQQGVSNESSSFTNTDKPNRCEDRGTGNGWGWNPALNQSCRFQTSTATVSSPSTNVVANNPTTNSGTPIVNQDTVPSYKFYKKDCIARNNGSIRHTWAEIPYRDYIIQHNVWNDSAMISSRGIDSRNQISLCTELNGGPKNPKPRWYYNFLNEYDGLPTQVKAYPQVYYGRKVDNASDSGTVAELGVPKRIKNLDTFHVEYKFSETEVGERNVALESFFHESCTRTQANKSKQFEMMVWVGRPTKRTGGTDKVGEAYIDGATWEVYINKNLKWRYVAYVRKEESKEGTLNWSAFIDYTKNELYKLNSSFSLPRLDENECMNGIELGTELFFGKGDFTLEKFNVVRYKK